MNTEDTDIHASFQSWWEKNSDLVAVHSTIRASAEVVWTACYTEVLKRLPGEWILLSEDHLPENDDEWYDEEYGEWKQMVLASDLTGKLVRRRISPVPEQQPPLGSPEGSASTSERCS